MAYRPSPWDESCNFYYWSPTQTLTTPKCPGLSYCNPKDAENNTPRIDLNDKIAAQNTRFFGYIAKMTLGKSENTETPFDLTIVGRIGFWEDGITDGPSWHWVKVKTWSSN